MKKILFLVVFSFSFFNVIAQTQMDLNLKAKMEYDNIDKKLNSTYQKIMLDYKVDTVFIKNAKIAQRQWIKFRDAQVNMKYPLYANNDETIQIMCRYYYLKELTLDRIKELKQWIDGTEEGDVCSGSIKIKQS